MLISDMQRRTLAERLRGDGVHLVTGAFTIRLQIELPRLVDEFADAYARHPVEDPPGIDDAHVRIASPSWLRRTVRPQAQVWADGDKLFMPVPAERAFTLVESGFNWAIAGSDVAPPLMHAAVLERDDCALIMPAPTGSGKSTLCAALACRGWRLFSDEMAIFSFDDGLLHPNPRPISLKNKAIDVICAFAPDARMTAVYRGTPRGDVAYMHPPADAVDRAQDRAAPGLVVAPTYSEGAAASLKELRKAEAFRLLMDNAVNYSSMLRAGFELLTSMVERCAVYTLTYSNLDEAIGLIDNLHRERAFSPSSM